jgi:hypothetical protein
LHAEGIIANNPTMMQQEPEQEIDGPLDPWSLDDEEEDVYARTLDETDQASPK